MKSYHLDSTDGPRRYYAKCNKSDRKRQIPYDFTHMWNLKIKINKQSRNRRIDAEIRMMAVRRVGWVKEAKGLRRTNW